MIGNARAMDIQITSQCDLAALRLCVRLKMPPFLKLFMKAAAINRAMHQGSLVAQVALLRRI